MNFLLHIIAVLAQPVANRLVQFPHLGADALDRDVQSLGRSHLPLQQPGSSKDDDSRACQSHIVITDASVTINLVYSNFQ